MKPHKHSALIKQWADGHKVEILSRVDGGWHEEEYPDWDEDYTYRIKDLEERLDSTKVVVERQWVGLNDLEKAEKEARDADVAAAIQCQVAYAQYICAPAKDRAAIAEAYAQARVPVEQRVAEAEAKLKIFLKREK